MVGFATTFAFSCLPTAFALQAREIHRVVVYFLAIFFRILNFLRSSGLFYNTPNLRRLFVSGIGLNLWLMNQIRILRVPLGTNETQGHWNGLCSRSPKPKTAFTSLRCIRSLGIWEDNHNRKKTAYLGMGFFSYSFVQLACPFPQINAYSGVSNISCKKQN